MGDIEFSGWEEFRRVGLAGFTELGDAGRGVLGPKVFPEEIWKVYELAMATLTMCKE